MAYEQISSDGMPPLPFDEPWGDAELREALPALADDANKFTRGVLTVVGGCARYPGAACLASFAGQRMGAGYTEVVTSKAARQAILCTHPSMVVYKLEDWQPDMLRSNEPGARHAVCVGSGFDPKDESTSALVVDVLEKASIAVVVDGGGLSALCSSESARAVVNRRARGCATVLTPHEGEAVRLARALGLNSSDPARLALLLAAALEAVVVVKGPNTYISDGERVIPMLEGTSVLAKAGTGDVLAGMIGSLLAQGAAPVDAAVLGATLHARAGIVAGNRLGVRCVASEDVIDALPEAVRQLS